MSEYITKMFDRLDRICEDKYGVYNSKVITALLDANAGLDQHGIVLPQGLVLDLPILPESTIEEVPIIPQILLWD